MKEVSLPKPHPDEVRIKVVAAGVAFGDIQLRRGVSPQALIVKRPFVPGFDIVGTVDAVGSNTSSAKVGQMVAAFVGVGGYSEFVCVPENELIPDYSTCSPPDTLTPSSPRKFPWKKLPRPTDCWKPARCEAKLC